VTTRSSSSRHSLGRPVLFIDFMPLDAALSWTKDLVVPSAEIVAKICEVWSLERASTAGDPSPAERFRFRDSVGEIGVVATVTQPFCATCDRLRLTADGHLRNCLFSEEEVPLREQFAPGVQRRGDRDGPAPFGVGQARRARQ
jgi:cyclic pyranopterin phosphate synthase